MATEIHMGQIGGQLPALCSGCKGRGRHGFLALEVFGFMYQTEREALTAPYICLPLRLGCLEEVTTARTKGTSGLMSMLHTDVDHSIQGTDL